MVTISELSRNSRVEVFDGRASTQCLECLFSLSRARKCTGCSNAYNTLLCFVCADIVTLNLDREITQFFQRVLRKGPDSLDGKTLR